jgi:peptide/nickel transport system substrate-binding protein
MGCWSLYDPLVTQSLNLRPQLILAEQLEPTNDGTEWSIRVRNGVEFSDGKPLRVLTSWEA